MQILPHPNVVTLNSIYSHLYVNVSEFFLIHISVLAASVAKQK